MGFGPGSSVQDYTGVDPMTTGCPQQVTLTVNRLFQVNKASIHSRQGLLLLAEGPVGVLGEATVSATVSEMDERGNTGRRKVYLGLVTS